jgi:PAS domain S-box-containing protein
MKSGVAVYMPSDDGTDFIFTDMNRTGEKINKIKKEDIIGKAVTAIFPGVKTMGLFDIFFKVSKTGIPEYLPAVLYSDDNMNYWTENYVYRLPSGEIVAIHDDITEKMQMLNAISTKNKELIKLNEELEALNEELTATNEELEAAGEEMEASNEELITSNNMLHQSEERFRHLFERAPAGIFQYNGLLVITDANDHFCRILGADKNQLIGLDMNNLRDLSILPALQEPYRNSEGLYEGLYKSTISASNIYISMKTVPIKDEYGQITSAMGIVDDITDFIRRDQEKEIYIKEIHHRVKNNLQVVTSLIGLQAMNLSNTETQAQLAIAQNRIRAMSLIHERLYQSDNYAEIDFEDYIKSIASELYHAYSDNSDGISLRFNTSPVKLSINQAIPCGIVVNELVTNCLKHAFNDKRTGGYIQVDLHERDNRVYITIEDNGIGLVDNNKPGNSSSLGLTLVSLEIQQLGGHLDIQKDGSTRFIISFEKK